MIEQLVVCLPAKPGKLARMCRVMGEEGVQIHALMVSENVDVTLVRLICDRPRATAGLLSDLGYDATTTDAVAIQVDNVPGALARLLDKLHSCDLKVAYAYSCSPDDRTVDVVKVSGEPIDIKLMESGLSCLEPEDLYVPDES